MARIGIKKLWHLKSKTEEGLTEKVTLHQAETGEILVPVSIYQNDKGFHVAWFVSEKKLSLKARVPVEEAKHTIIKEG
tara:strand:+ start:493 stop:726 length:234 start_codon:yes stop_codon:yes gene_type:complete